MGILNRILKLIEISADELVTERPITFHSLREDIQKEYAALNAKKIYAENLRKKINELIKSEEEYIASARNHLEKDEESPAREALKKARKIKLERNNLEKKLADMERSIDKNQKELSNLEKHLQELEILEDSGKKLPFEELTPGEYDSLKKRILELECTLSALEEVEDLNGEKELRRKISLLEEDSERKKSS